MALRERTDVSLLGRWQNVRDQSARRLALSEVRSSGDDAEQCKTDSVLSAFFEASSTATRFDRQHLVGCVDDRARICCVQLYEACKCLQQCLEPHPKVRTDHSPSSLTSGRRRNYEERSLLLWKARHKGQRVNPALKSAL